MAGQVGAELANAWLDEGIDLRAAIRASGRFVRKEPPRLAVRRCSGDRTSGCHGSSTQEQGLPRLKLGTLVDIVIYDIGDNGIATRDGVVGEEEHGSA